MKKDTSITDLSSLDIRDFLSDIDYHAREAKRSSVEFKYSESYWKVVDALKILMSRKKDLEKIKK